MLRRRPPTALPIKQGREEESSHREAKAHHAPNTGHSKAALAQFQGSPEKKTTPKGIRRTARGKGGTVQFVTEAPKQRKAGL